ncbi:hypothetical protein PMIN02_008378 [Paraphaeosphaeria minitans]|uniref:Zn(2)-C6 fungal-type domain-containing protein n=1 Tax=Paraphaeosphaeria minitans TaxID=565426 RepID=A0A9P6KMR3_9PLEO|nr:hypothetical protein PMIN01_10786 [Paraphaeosphaeria minitans]
MNGSHRRTRGGCVNCKKRKRKCDEQRPRCMACIDRNIRCDGYAHPVRWVEGIASRGRFVGVRDPGLLLQPTETTTATSEADDHVAFPSPVESVETTPLQFPRHTVRVAEEDQNCISDEERIAFEKFLDTGLHQLFNAEVYCWLSVFFRALSKQSRALPLVGAALQAYYDNGWTVTAMERTDRAIRTFRADLDTLGSQRRSATICSGLLICSICLYQSRPITPYLRLLVDVHDLKGNLEGLKPNPLVHVPSHHVLEVLGVMDMTSFLIGRLHPSIGIWKRMRDLRSDTSHRVLGDIEAVTGLPRTLLDIFSEITEECSGISDIEAMFWCWTGCVGTIDQCHLWDSWRYAGILDVRRRWRNRWVPNAPCGNHVFNSLDPAASNEAVLCRLVASLDALSRKAKTVGGVEPSFLNKGLMFPFTLANLEIPLLKANPSWKSTLEEFQSVFLSNDNVTLGGSTVLILIKEAWEAGIYSFDIDQAARHRGVEIGIF